MKVCGWQKRERKQLKIVDDVKSKGYKGTNEVVWDRKNVSSVRDLPRAQHRMTNIMLMIRLLSALSSCPWIFHSDLPLVSQLKPYSWNYIYISDRNVSLKIYFTILQYSNRLPIISENMFHDSPIKQSLTDRQISELYHV